MPGEVFLTRQGYEELRQKLESLRVRRQELAGEIAEAREKGDLKENAEYHAAKEEQAKVSRRMDEMEEKLRSARIIEEAGIASDEVRIGCTVTLKDEKSGDEMTYTLVDAAEADFAKGRISVRAPLAQAILGHKKGDQVPVALPAGKMTYKVLDIARSL